MDRYKDKQISASIFCPIEIFIVKLVHLVFFALLFLDRQYRQNHGAVSRPLPDSYVDNHHVRAGLLELTLKWLEPMPKVKRGSAVITVDVINAKLHVFQGCLKIVLL